MLLRSSNGCAINTFKLIQLITVICPMGRVTGQGESRTQSPVQVVQDLLIRHGDNSTITVPQLRALLELLSQGQEKGDGVSSTTHSPATTPTRTNSSKVRGKNKTYLITETQEGSPTMYVIPPVSPFVLIKCYLVRKIKVAILMCK